MRLTPQNNTGDIGDMDCRISTRRDAMQAFDALPPSTRAILHKCPLPMSPVDAFENWFSMRYKGYSIKAYNAVMTKAFEDVTGVKAKDWM